MDLRKLLDKLGSIQEADLTPQQQAQNVLQPGSQKSSADAEREKEYARAQAQMARLEKAAQYSGDDEIIRSRMGLPAKLPSIAQWDGKMPEPSGKPDWLARLSGAGDAQKGAMDANRADNTNTAFKKEKLTKLNDLISQLQKLGGTGNSSNATAGTTGAPNMGQVNNGGMNETSIFESLLREFQEELVDTDIAEAVKPEVQAIIDQINAIMSELGDMSDDQEIANALQSAQTAIDDANKTAEQPAAATSNTSKIDPAKLARFKELLAKAGPATPGAKPAPAVAPKTESMSELIARVQRIAEGQLDEALTPQEKTELDALAKELETFTGEDPELDALLLQHTKLSQVAGADKPKPAGADPAVQKIQEQLKALNIDPGPIDGRMGPKTVAGIKAFEKMAGKPETGKVTPELSTMLADGKNIVARSQLTQSLTAIEALVTKYKISESVTEEDVLAMTEEEAKVFVMKNIKYFSESEQIAIMRDYLSEAPVPALPGAGGSRLPALPGAPAGNPNVIDVPFKDITPKPSFGQRAMNFVKNMGFPSKKNIIKAVAGSLGLGGLYAAFSGDDIEMEPTDLAELQKHLKVLDQYGKDPAIKTGLPADVQKRLDVVIAKLDKLRKLAPAAAPAAAPAGTMQGF